jgi:threonine dehydrogenase-like Zn-dependent dehydrogenase
MSAGTPVIDIDSMTAATAARQRPRLMRAMVLAAPRRFEMREVPLPEPREGQARVRIEGCGVCASNIPPFEGREWFEYPMAPGQLGHEAWGTVDAVGPEFRGFSAGERVAFLSERAYAEYDVTDPSRMVSLRDVPPDRPFPAEPLGCAINIMSRAGVSAGQTVAIVGVGFMGALLIQLAKGAGARVIAIGRRPFALDIARRAGADAVIAMDDHARIIEQVRQLTDGQWCDVVIECAGKQWPLDLSAQLTRVRGRLVIAGYHQDGPRQVNMQLWNWRGLDVINAHERDPQVYLDGMRAAVDEVSAGRLDPSSLFTHRLPLEELSKALEMTRDRPDGFLKALIMMS